MNQTKELALCSVLAAMAVVLLCIEGVIQIAFYLCPMVASVSLIIAREECRKSYAVSCFAVSAFLGLLLCPDKECAAMYLFLGWYPLLQPKLNRISHRIPRVFLKGAILTVTMGVMYAMLFYIIGFTPVVEELSTVSFWLLIITIIMGIVLFALYDRVIVIFTRVYLKKRRKLGTGKMMTPPKERR